jgi:hypothetical protein
MVSSMGFGKQAPKATEADKSLLLGLSANNNVDIESIRSLLEKGANPYEKDKEGVSAFEYANQAKNLEVMHLMYQFFPNDEYAKNTLEVITLAKIEHEFAKGNFNEVTKITSYSDKSNIPVLRERAEKLALEKGENFIGLEDNIVIFKDFLSKKPLIGRSVDGNGSLLKGALDFALDKFSTNPELLDQVVSLAVEQNKDNNKLKEDLSKRLVEYSNNKIVTHPYAEKLNAIIQTVGITPKEYIFGNLSADEKRHLANISLLIDDTEEMQKIIDGKDQEWSLNESSLIDIHKSVQALQNTKLPLKLANRINASVIAVTNQYLNKTSDIGSISRISDIAYKTEVYLKSFLEEVRPNNIEDLKLLYLRNVVRDIFSGKDVFSDSADLTKLTELELKKFNEFLMQNPSIGDLEDSKSVGGVALKIALMHATTHPEILDNVVGLAKAQSLERVMQDSHDNNETSLEDLSVLGSHLIEMANKAEDEKVRLAIVNSVKNHLKGYLKLDDGYRVNSMILNASKAGNTKMVDLLLTTYPKQFQDAKGQIDYNGISALYNDGHIDSVKTLLHSPKSINHYLSEASENPDLANHKLVKFIFDNKGKHEISLDENSVILLVNSAMKLGDTKMIADVIQDISKGNNIELLDQAFSLINDDSKRMNNLIKEMYKDDSQDHDIITNFIMQNISVKNLDAESIKTIAPFYNPDADEKGEFLNKILDFAYTKGINFEKMKASVSLIMSGTSNINEAINLDGMDKQLKDYVDTRNSHETKPIWTMVKAIFKGKSLEQYKADKIKDKAFAIRLFLSADKEDFGSVETASTRSNSIDYTQSVGQNNFSKEVSTETKVEAKEKQLRDIIKTFRDKRMERRKYGVIDSLQAEKDNIAFQQKLQKNPYSGRTL